MELLEEAEDRNVEQTRQAAWDAFSQPILKDRQELVGLVGDRCSWTRNRLVRLKIWLIDCKLIHHHSVARAERGCPPGDDPAPAESRALHARRLSAWQKRLENASQDRFSSYLYQQGKCFGVEVAEVQSSLFG